MNELQDVVNLKYLIIKEDEVAYQTFETIFGSIKKALMKVYHPREPFSVAVNMTERLSHITDDRMRAILYEAIVESHRDLGWIVNPKIQDKQEYIYIQRHK